MSRDLIVFDPSGLKGMSGDTATIIESIERYFSENEIAHNAPEPVATTKVKAFLDSVDGQYLTAYLNANGRYANINRPGESEYWENTVMDFYFHAQKAGVILVDPQSNEPIISTPSGDGLLDGM